MIVIDDRCCMVQLAVRVSQFYEHESCGKCTPCRVGTKLADARSSRRSRRVAARRPTWTCSSRRRRAHQRQVPLPARRLRRDRRDELRRQVPRRVPGPHRRGRLPLPRRVVARRHRSRPSRCTSTRRTSARTRSTGRSRWSRDRARQAHDRRPRGRGAEGHRPRRDGRGGRDRDPGLLLRAAARAAGRRLPHVPRRGRGPAEAPGRLHADRAGRDGRADRGDLRRRPPRARTRRSSSSSSTTRSTAPSATRAASARCRT